MFHEELDIANMLPATFTAPQLSEEEFLALCAKFPDATLEYTADGTIVIMPPTDPASSAIVAYVARMLGNWADEQGLGIVMGPDGGFRFPGDSRRSPDAAWMNAARWKTGIRHRSPLSG